MQGRRMHQDGAVSMDIFLQDFADAPADKSEAVQRVLGPYFDESRGAIITADGDAEVYGADDTPVNGLMFTHVTGEVAWDLMYEVAVAADWVIMPVGGPVCIVSEEQRATIREDLEDVAVVLVHSGTVLLAVATTVAG
ncbi:hypothetical protein CLV46_2954 [Diaminobutyricimonas aerilata]|uniref:Uncharacterized protein n=1 Tax=Diaminobutyricimonas aerilata TaxID=1162967 RepID=A0A2M9CN97_9MICO|nr:hypothetical protein CLV46_2954 [Diaminobutyricimonas aerilata]